MALSKQTNKKQCMNSKKRLFSWYYLRLFCTGLILLPIALVLILIRRSLLLIQLLFLRRPMIKEPVHFIRSEAVTEIDEWNNYDDEKKTIEIARFLAERNFDIPNKQNNEQNDLTKFPEIPYDDPLR